MNLKLKKHEKILKEKVFFTKDRWPHFNLLFDDIKKLSKKKNIKTVVSIERGNLYGSISLLAPFFHKKKFTSIDCSSSKIQAKGAYNKKFVESKKIIKTKTTYFRDYKNLKIKKNSCDLIIIPNLMHHIFDHELLIKNCKKILKKNGLIYIFEPLLRELHQAPDDYLRFTPFGFKEIFLQTGFKNIKYKLSGGPFTAALYCLHQASEYLPKKERKLFEKKFLKQQFIKMINLEKKYKKNLVRNSTLFPVSFSIIGKV